MNPIGIDVVGTNTDAVLLAEERVGHAVREARCGVSEPRRACHQVHHRDEIGPGAHSGPCVAGIPLLFSVPARGSAPSARIET